MNKFRIGDKVEVVKGGRGVSRINEGRTTVITEVGGVYLFEDLPAVKTKDFPNFVAGGWIAEETFKLVHRKREDEIIYN